MKSRGDTAVMIVCGLALLAALSVAQAQSLPDPTRPPAAVAAPAAEAPEKAAEAPAGLQAIIWSNCAKPAVIVNGQHVTLGGRVGDARVVKIGEDSVTLQGPNGKETLKLMPGVEKREQTGKPEDKSGNKGQCDKRAGTGVAK